MSDTPTTSELVVHLRLIGLPASAEGLRQDQLRRRLSPLMPSFDWPGRGHPARWSAIGVRRAIYIARLRKRGVDGRVLPMLAYLRDAWGWEAISESVANAAAGAAEVDRRAARVTRIKDFADLEDLAAADVGDALFTPAEVGLREYLLSILSQKIPGPGMTAVPFAEQLIRDLAKQLGEPIDEEELAAARERGTAIEEARRSWGIGPQDLPEWLRSIDSLTANRGRQRLLAAVLLFRPVARKSGLTGNPLTFFAMSQASLGRFLRTSTGRPTPSQLLGLWLAQEIYAAELEHRVDSRSK